MTKQHKILAYFLPQFHECPFNNKWWGKGFTEWNNVQAAQPLKDGHYQPRVPADGYYDLTDDGILQQQFSHARDHGVDGFAIYHYWYDGERPLGKPLDKILADPSIDVNFSLCWANHSWTRSWKNRRGSADVLIEQTYASQKRQREKHYAYLLKAFSDRRYIDINGRPLFQIYIPEDVEDLEQYIDGLRDFVRTRSGLELHIAATVRSRQASYDYLRHFDSLTLAQPTLALFADDNLFAPRVAVPPMQKFFREKALQLPMPLKKLVYNIQDLTPDKPSYFYYDTVWSALLRQTERALETAPIQVNFSGFTEFDNTPRYVQRAKVIEGFSPEKFGHFMTRLIELARTQSSSVLFINAWNEWGEGMHLEGDQKYPDGRLVALKNALSSVDG
ncbi:glycosyltransferase WbsX family protein [Alterisphingorhabdus coralli]|uniref:Glycoside hydrolase family 99-like domain-containing protein n=1 Tax=Alterisphingorhabdus coralli TaxID=3071408 RepID=A0AA97F6E6_9SPHN|nr:glycoside hydrolase family 99-like domain-containing protein [Parasphingorhabdus sp. SCSIO 66989]WOE74803.1 glycoside hydrolase family 99-like domain-containing protein [Parasphingorhabdus sp. SCSIO 66989]